MTFDSQATGEENQVINGPRIVQPQTECMASLTYSNNTPLEKSYINATSTGKFPTEQDSDGEFGGQEEGRKDSGSRTQIELQNLQIATQIQIMNVDNIHVDVADHNRQIQSDAAQRTQGQGALNAQREGDPGNAAAADASPADPKPASAYEDSPGVSKRKTIYKKDMSMTSGLKGTKTTNGIM